MIENKKLPTIDDLLELSNHNVTLRSFVTLWRTGAFASLEQMLIATVMYMADENKKLMENEVQRMMDSWPSIAVVTDQAALEDTSAIVRAPAPPEPPEPEHGVPLFANALLPLFHALRTIRTPTTADDVPG